MRTDTGGASSSALGVAEGDGVAEADGAGAGAVDGKAAVLEGTGSAVADDGVAGGWAPATPVSAQPLTNSSVSAAPARRPVRRSRAALITEGIRPVRIGVALRLRPEQRGGGR